MIAGPFIDLEGAVDLLQYHHPGQMVGKGHGGHGQAQLGLRFDGGMQAVAAPDEKYQMLAPAILKGLNELRQLRAGFLLPLYAEGD